MSSRESCGGEKIDEVRSAMQVVQEDQTLLSWELEWVNPHCLCMVDSCIHRWVLSWGCITPTPTHQAAPLAWLRIMCLHSHAHTEEAPIPPLWSALRADPPRLVLTWPPILFLFSPSLIWLHFFCPFDVFQTQANVVQKLCQCNACPARSGRWEKLSGIQGGGRSANKSSYVRYFQKQSKRQGQRPEQLKSLKSYTEHCSKAQEILM